MDTRDPGTLLAARSGSPLVIGLGMGENFIASDQLALLPVTRRFIFLEEGDIAEVTRRSVVIFDKSAAQVKRQEIESICSMTLAIKVSTATICRKRFSSSRTRLRTP